VPVDLRAVAEAALRRPVSRSAVTARREIVYDPYVSGRVVERVVATAEMPSTEPIEWTAIVKRTTGVAVRAARRELMAYRTGLAASARADGLRAPALLAWDDRDGSVELWLEAVTDRHAGTWPVEAFTRSASHIATWDAAVGENHSPDDFDWEDAWAERHGQPERVTAVVDELDELRRMEPARPLMRELRDPGFQRTEGLIRSTEERIQRLATFPIVPLHHDLVRSNLFSQGQDETVAIDWENVGRGPFGVDLTPLVIGSVRRGEASADDLEAIESAVLASYSRSLLEAGLDREADVRSAYALALGLRWHVVLGTIRSALHPGSRAGRGSRPEEPRSEALRHLVAVSRHILDVGELRG
jgi:hypothetical protein